jgi:hypothetical protein
VLVLVGALTAAPLAYLLIYAMLHWANVLADPEARSASRPSGQWRDNDYDVLEDGVVVGRIFLVPAAPAGRSWVWASGHADKPRGARLLTTKSCL